MADDAAEEEPLRGKFFFENGATYEGEYAVLPPDPEAEVKDGEEPKERRIRQGQGLYIEGDYSYEGQWLDDKMHGAGTLRFASGAMYTGEFAENKYMGQGTHTFPDGVSKYVGPWQDSRMHGLDGLYTDKESHVWKGQVRNEVATCFASLCTGLGEYSPNANPNATKTLSKLQFYNGSGPGLTCQM